MGAPDLLDAVVKVKRASPRQTYPSSTELELILEVPSLAARWMFLCAAEGGLRSGTAARVTPAMIQEGRMVVPTKNHCWADVPLSPRLTRLLVLLPPGCDRSRPVAELFHGQPLNDPAQLGRIALRKWLKHLGIDRRITLHDLRRGLARRLFAATGDLRQVQGLLTHVNLSSTFWYLNGSTVPLSKANLDEALKERLA